MKEHAKDTFLIRICSVFEKMREINICSLVYTVLVNRLFFFKRRNRTSVSVWKLLLLSEESRIHTATTLTEIFLVFLDPTRKMSGSAQRLAAGCSEGLA
jgi:hypothetical protein